MDRLGPPRSSERTMRLVATYLIGLAIGLVLLGLWQQARRQSQRAGQTEQQAPAPASPEPGGAP